jgi:hypothetical protein
MKAGYSLSGLMSGKLSELNLKSVSELILSVPAAG